ncbi:MAG: hypothetical protein AAFV86_23420, partial [Pseudomonadota bacterium]
RTLPLHGDFLRAARDADRGARKDPSGMAEPMPAEAFALLENLLAAHNTYVNTDPALARWVQALDDPTARRPGSDADPAEIGKGIDALAPALEPETLDFLQTLARAVTETADAGQAAIARLQNTWFNLSVLLARNTIQALRTSVEAIGNAADAARPTIEEAVAAGRAVAALAVRRAAQGAAGLATIEASPALADFARRVGPTVIERVAPVADKVLDDVLYVAIVACLAKLYPALWRHADQAIRDVLDRLKDDGSAAGKKPDRDADGSDD